MKARIIAIALLTSSVSQVTFAHDPIFGQGPHVLFKDGFEVATEFHSSKKGDELENEIGLEVKYGLTSAWVMGIALPYGIKAE